MKAILFAAICVGLVAAQTTTIGSCVLRGTAADSGITGTVTFELTSGSPNVTVTAVINGITVNPSALHGMHVHQYGDLVDTSGSATSVGTHWQSTVTTHGCETTSTRHLGDMGNWDVVAGSINQTKTLDLLELTGNLSIIGRAVVLHNLTDDCATTASSGSRLAFCVIGIANPAYHGYTAAATNVARNEFNPAPRYAACDLVQIGTSGVSGRFFFNQTSSSGPTIVTGVVLGITGPQGVHVHTYGELSVNGSAAGGHYNPTGASHGLPPNNARHVGDMGNIFFYNGTNAYYKYTNTLISLTGAQSVIGRTIIVHGQEDNCDANNLGPRVAQCVIGILPDTTTNQVIVPSNTDESQDSAACATFTDTDTTDTGSSGFALVPAMVLLVLSVLAALL